MKHLTLAGHRWTAYSPSMLVLTGYPIKLVYNGRAWYLAYDGEFDGARPWPSRDAAASAIAAAFLAHEKEEKLI